MTLFLTSSSPAYGPRFAEPVLPLPDEDSVLDLAADALPAEPFVNALVAVTLGFFAILAADFFRPAFFYLFGAYFFSDRFAISMNKNSLYIFLIS